MIFVSTGGRRDLSCAEHAEFLFECGISEIELSGGQFDPKLVTRLKKLSEAGAHLTLHNYIPHEQEAFVINLASSDKNIIDRSFDSLKRSLALSADLNSRHFGFHAGFLLDPKPEELGKEIKPKGYQTRRSALSRFVDNTFLLAEFARDVGVQLLVENNVISSRNYENFNGCPLLLCNPDEITHFFEVLNGEVSLLLDLGHLKVSANSLSFDLTEGLHRVLPFVGGVHFSDNDGYSDENKPVQLNSWFSGVELNYHYKVIEVYNHDIKTLKQQIRTIDQIIRK